MSYDPWTPLGRPNREEPNDSVRAIRWALHALGFDPSYTWLTDLLARFGALDPDGHPDPDGGRLALALATLLSPWHFEAEVTRNACFEAAQAQVQADPVLLYTRAWSDWIGVRGYSPRQRALILVTDPAVDPVLPVERYAVLGPFAALRVSRAAPTRGARGGKDG